MPDPLPSANDWKAYTLVYRRNLQPALLPLMNSIDTDLGLYAQAFSMMAKRNVASDIYYLAVGLRDAWPGARGGENAPQVVLKLIEQAREAVEATGGTTKRQYDTAVCIGWRVKLSSFVQSHGIWVVDYQGAVDNRADMLFRCGAMRTAIEEAYDAYDAKYPAPPSATGLRRPDRTLRIFMAPEFFFRGRSGAYSAKVGFEVLSHLRDETNKAKYKNWLFVLGTVVMATFVEETVCPQCNAVLKKDWAADTANYTTNIDGVTGRSTMTCNTCHVPGKRHKVGAMIDNLALVQKGGEAGEINSYTVAKEYVSRVDFKRNVILDQSGSHLPHWDKNPQVRSITVMGQGTTALPPEGSRDLSLRPVGSKFLDERMGGGGAVFDIDGIRFGLEVCLDHAENRLTGRESVSIQLVPSCGMSFQSFKCLAGGLYFGVDAGTPECDLRINGPAPPINKTSPNCSVGGFLDMFDPVPIA